MSKIVTACSFIRRQTNEPYTVEDVQLNAHVSYSTASRALSVLWHISTESMHMAYQQHNGNFYKLYFPLGWTRQACQTWLDENTKSGKSKAKLYGNKDVA